MSNVHMLSPEESSNATTFSMEQVRAMVKQLNEIEDQVKDLREQRKQIVADFVEEYGVPKKEVTAAIRMLKSGTDPEIVSEVYAHIADLVK
jgi:uncharacterized protein (UPF0335 family)